MTSLTSPVALYEARRLTSERPKTLARAIESFKSVEILASTKLRDEIAPEVAARIAEAARAGIIGDDRCRTLPQAIVKLETIAELLAAAPTAPGAASSVANGQNFLGAPRGPLSKGNPDSDAFDRYVGLKGAERFAFFQANREALMREDARRKSAEKQAIHADLVSAYLSLTGKARAEFYAKHQNELWRAYRARHSFRS